jgi:hypothetical protein
MSDISRTTTGAREFAVPHVEPLHSSTAWHVARLKAVLDAATVNNHRGEVHIKAWVNLVKDGIRLVCDECGDETDTDRELVYYVREGGGHPFDLAAPWYCTACLPGKIRRGEVVLENPEVVAEEIARIVALDAEDLDGRKRETAA